MNPHVNGLARAAIVFLALCVALTFAGCPQITQLLGSEDEKAASAQLKVSVAGIGTTTPDGSVSITEGKACAISVEPAPGFAFVRWEVYIGSGVTIDDPSNPETTVTLTDGDAIVRALLGDADQATTLTVEASEGGRTIPDGEVSATVGDPIAIRAVASEGYEFDGWTIVEGEGATIRASGRADTTITLTSGDVTIRAGFFDTAIDRDGSLIVQGSAGGRAEPTGNHIIAYGTPMEVTAIADPGYTFAGWAIASDSASGAVTIANETSLSTTLTLVSGDATVEAHFTPPEEYTLTLQAGTGGSVTNAGAQTVLGGGATTISATPASGFSFDHWRVISGSGVSFGNTTSSSTTVTLSESDAVVEARFEEIPSRTATISGVAWSTVLDADRDGYAEAAVLDMDVSISGGGGSFAIRLDYTPARGQLPQLYDTEEFFLPGTMYVPESISFTVGGLAQDTYDFNVRVYYGGTLIGSTGAAPLTGKRFEP